MEEADGLTRSQTPKLGEAAGYRGRMGEVDKSAGPIGQGVAEA